MDDIIRELNQTEDYLDAVRFNQPSQIEEIENELTEEEIFEIT